MEWTSNPIADDQTEEPTTSFDFDTSSLDQAFGKVLEIEVDETPTEPVDPYDSAVEHVANSLDQLAAVLQSKQ